jgi:hypothetical protein
MRHLKSINVAVNPVEADVGDMVLAAGVETATDFDAQIFDRLIELQTLFAQAGAQLARQTARRRYAQLASVRAGACRYIDMVAASGAPRPMALMA